MLKNQALLNLLNLSFQSFDKLKVTYNTSNKCINCKNKFSIFYDNECIDFCANCFL